MNMFVSKAGKTWGNLSSYLPIHYAETARADKDCSEQLKLGFQIGNMIFVNDLTIETIKLITGLGELLIYRYQEYAKCGQVEPNGEDLIDN